MVVDQLDLAAVALAPAGVHPLQHLGPVLALGAARAGVDLDIGVVGVGFAGEQRRDLVALGALGQLGEARARLVDQRVVAFGLGHLDELDGVGQLALDRPGRADRLFEPAALAHDLLRRLGIVPQRRVLDPGVELVEPAQRAVPVEEPAQQRGRGLDLVDMGLRFGAHRSESFVQLRESRAGLLDVAGAALARIAVGAASAGGRERPRPALPGAAAPVRGGCRSAASCRSARLLAVLRVGPGCGGTSGAARSAAGTLPRSPATWDLPGSGRCRTRGVPVARSTRTQRMPAGATNGTLGSVLERRLGELLEDRRGDPAALGIAAHGCAAGRSRCRRRRRHRACRRRTTRWSGPRSCRSCRTAGGRGRAARSRCRARPRRSGCGPSGTRPSGRATGGCGSAAAASPRRPSRRRCNCSISCAAVVGAVDDLAVAVLDIVDQRRLHRAPVVGEDRIGVGQLEHRGVAGAERDRQIIRDNRRRRASRAVSMTLAMPVCDAARTVIRLRDCSTPQRIVLGPE